METNKTVKLSNGVEVPVLGLGTWFIEDGAAADVVRLATSLGYRHIDTAQAYGNEHGVGEGVRNCGLRREEVFVTDKVAAEAKSYKDAMDSIDKSLVDMGLDYIDLMIIHSPQPWAGFRGDARFFDENREIWRALEDAYKAGKLRSIGLSNFLEDDVDNILSSCTVAPMVNQVLAHIGNTPSALMEHCTSKGIVMEAYSPIAHGEVLGNSILKEMAARYNASVAQLCIAYTLQLGMVSLPKASSRDHLADNATIDFTINVEDMETLKAFKKIEDYGEYSVFPVFSGR